MGFFLGFLQVKSNPPLNTLSFVQSMVIFSVLKGGFFAMKSDIFSFVEKEDVPFAIEKSSGDIFRMDARDLGSWVEIEDPDSRCRIRLNSSSISESEAMMLADEMAEDIAALRKDVPAVR
ncbi:MAG: hypothetical protein Q7U74_10330 [Saprospiraceae bacterium]|nr:hypothetical protein [Saprospiraceae bacterium]